MARRQLNRLKDKLLESAIALWQRMEPRAVGADSVNGLLDLIIDAMIADDSVETADRLLAHADLILKSSDLELARASSRRRKIALFHGQWLPALVLLDERVKGCAGHIRPTYVDAVAAYSRVFLLSGLGREEAAAIALPEANAIADRLENPAVGRLLYWQSMVGMVHFFCKNRRIKAAEAVLDQYGRKDPSAEVAAVLTLRDRGALRQGRW